MHLIPLTPRTPAASTEGFSRTDLLACVVAVLVFGLALAPALGRENNASEQAACLANLKQIMTAVSAYALENNDALPHPSWGYIPSIPGPDNWCYAPYAKGQTPDTRIQIPSASGRPAPFGHTNQLPFYALGQLAPYLSGQQTLVCPTDWSTAQTASPQGSWYAARELKLTSYSMNGAVSGYGGREALGSSVGGTYPLNRFAPSSIFFWSPPESMVFAYNDAASNPLNSSEGPSERHYGLDPLAPSIHPVNAFGHVARADGSVELLPAAAFIRLRSAGAVGKPNDLLCGPGFE